MKKHQPKYAKEVPEALDYPEITSIEEPSPHVPIKIIEKGWGR